jgi:hypothetical protein
LKPFHVRITYNNASIGISGQGTTTLLKGNEADNDETDQTENEAAALKAEGGVEMGRENEIFSDESYIPRDSTFAVII